MTTPEKASLVGAILALSPILVWSFLSPMDLVAVVAFTYLHTVLGYTFACWLQRGQGAAPATVAADPIAETMQISVRDD